MKWQAVSSFCSCPPCLWQAVKMNVRKDSIKAYVVRARENHWSVMEKLFYFPSSFHSQQIAPKTIPRTRTNISVMRQMPRPRAGAVTEGRCWWCLRRRAICLAMVLGDGTGNWSEMELEVMEVIRQYNSTRLQMNCDALSYEQKGCNGNSDFFENAVAILDGVMKSFCSKCVLRCNNTWKSVFACKTHCNNARLLWVGSLSV